MKAAILIRGFRFAGIASIFYWSGGCSWRDWPNPLLSLNFISALTALVKDLYSQKFVVSATYPQIYVFEDGVPLVRIITVIICCLKSLAAPRASINQQTGPNHIFLSHLLWTTQQLLAFRYVRFSAFNFCLFILQLWACFPEPSRRSDRFKIQEGGLQGVHERQLHTAQSEDGGGGTLGNPRQVALTAHRLSLSERIPFQKLRGFQALLTWKTRNTDAYCSDFTLNLSNCWV